MRTLPILLLALAACSTGTVSLSDKADDTGITGGDDTGAPSDDTGEAPDTEPPPNAWSGDWEAEIVILFPEWDYTFCEGTLELQVDDEGAMEGSGECVDDSGWGGDRVYDVTLEGAVSEEGEITGELIVFVPGWGGDVTEYVGELEGEAGDESLDFQWAVELDWGNWGPSEAVGEAHAEPQ